MIVTLSFPSGSPLSVSRLGRPEKGLPQTLQCTAVVDDVRQSVTATPMTTGTTMCEALARRSALLIMERCSNIHRVVRTYIHACIRSGSAARIAARRDRCT